MASSTGVQASKQETAEHHESATSNVVVSGYQEWSLEEIQNFENKASLLASGAQLAKIEAKTMQDLINSIPYVIRKEYGLPLNAEQYSQVVQQSDMLVEHIYRAVKETRLAWVHHNARADTIVNAREGLAKEESSVVEGRSISTRLSSKMLSLLEKMDGECNQHKAKAKANEDFEQCIALSAASSKLQRFKMWFGPGKGFHQIEQEKNKEIVLNELHAHLTVLDADLKAQLQNAKDAEEWTTCKLISEEQKVLAKYLGTSSDGSPAKHAALVTDDHEMYLYKQLVPIDAKLAQLLDKNKNAENWSACAVLARKRSSLSLITDELKEMPIRDDEIVRTLSDENTTELEWNKAMENLKGIITNAKRAKTSH